MPRRRPEFEPGFTDAEAAQLEKVERCRQAQRQWLPDEGRNQLLKLFGYEVWHERTVIIQDFGA
jgi:hypothetical protein